MARINLLPWRAERRKQREREFYTHLVMAFAAAVVVVMLWAFWMGLRISNQNDRNAYLKSEIKQLDIRIAKIKNLERVRGQLLARKKIIEQLQSNRSQMVHLFDELVKTIPDSVRLTAMHQRGNHMSLAGVAQSNASVAEYMRNIEASPWLGHVDLRKTENSHRGGRMPYRFSLEITLNKPTDAAELAAAASAAEVPAEASTAGEDAASPASSAGNGGAKR